MAGSLVGCKAYSLTAEQWCSTVTVIPPTQEDTVLGSRKNTVR